MRSDGTCREPIILRHRPLALEDVDFHGVWLSAAVETFPSCAWNVVLRWISGVMTPPRVSTPNAAG